LWGNSLRLLARHKAKQFDVFVQVFELKFGCSARHGLVNPKARKVANDDDLRRITLSNAVKVRQRLRERGIQVFAARLLFYQQHARPKQIDKPVGLGRGAGQLFDRVLKGGHTFVGDTEDLKKINPERLALTVFIGRVRPRAAEGESVGFDFVPREGHGLHFD
jgi:hypothetical protein